MNKTIAPIVEFNDSSSMKTIERNFIQKDGKTIILICPLLMAECPYYNSLMKFFAHTFGQFSIACHYNDSNNP